MGLYDVDFDVVVQEFVPVDPRKPRRLAWLRSLLAGVKALFGFFLTFRTARLYELAHNGQVCYLEAALNDVFDPVGRGINIQDGQYLDPIYVYQANEEKPVYVAKTSELPVTGYAAPVYLFTDAETYSLGVQFVVRVPGAVAALDVYDINRLRAIVDKYRLASKRNYTVVIF